jgi:hypothetical protein
MNVLELHFLEAISDIPGPLVVSDCHDVVFFLDPHAQHAAPLVESSAAPVDTPPKAGDPQA